MVMIPQVSVIMPVYNVERYVAAAIRSVLTQTFSNFELIIVDDGGNDASMEICRSFKDHRVRIIKQANRGLAGARNTGIRNAQGDFIALLDSDDIWREDKLAQHMEHLRANPAVGVSYSASELIDESGCSIGLFQLPKLANITVRDVFCRNPVGNGSAPVFRREALDAIVFIDSRHGQPEQRWFDEDFRYSEDIECWMRIACQTDWKFEGLEEPLTLYRIVAGGLSANADGMYQYWCRMHDKVDGYSPEVAASHGPAARAYQLRYYARRAVHAGSALRGLKYFVKALHSCPRIIFEEPARTGSTLLAIVAGCIVPVRHVVTLKYWITEHMRSSKHRRLEVTRQA
jgi:glycosyltransferase involved in cell wall biosynthesis